MQESARRTSSIRRITNSWTDSAPPIRVYVLAILELMGHPPFSCPTLLDIRAEIVTHTGAGASQASLFSSNADHRLGAWERTDRGYETADRRVCSLAKRPLPVLPKWR